MDAREPGGNPAGKPTRNGDVKSSKTDTSDLTHPPRHRYLPSVSTLHDSAAPTGDLAGPSGPPPRRASLLEIRFAFGTEVSPADAVPGPAVGAASGSAAGAAVRPEVAPVEARSEPPRPTLDVEPLRREPAPVFVTATMAELYRAQGMPERALDIYRTLLEREPHREDLAARVHELEAGRAGGDRSPPMLAALSFEGVRIPAAEATPDPAAEPSARTVLRALGDRRVGGTIARDLGAAAAAIGETPLHAAVALDDAFADWT